MKTSTGPEGYYTASQAQRKLGLNRNTFQYYVRQGKIKRHVPPLRKEGLYEKKEIDDLANQIALFFHTSTQTLTETRVASDEDVPGIVEVLTSMGWQSATVEQRLSWYKVNDSIDYVVISGGKVAGYVTAVPYTETAMNDMMSGRKRAWNITPDDILPYTPGQFDLYVGAAVRQELGNHTLLAYRLIAGFISFLEELAMQGIRVRRLYAVSAEPDGQRLCSSIGFVEQPAQEGDLFPRYMLDLETSPSRFAQQYRESVGL